MIKWSKRGILRRNVEILTIRHSAFLIKSLHSL